MTHATKPNSWVSQIAGSTTQLSYALQLNPAPFTVSVPGEDPILGSLEFVITNPTRNALYVTSVGFTIEVGTASNCITPTTAGILTAMSDNVNWIVTGPGTVTSGSATFTLEPATGSSVSLAAGASVIVQIFEIQTNTVPGNSIVAVKEMIVSTPPAFTQFQVTTFPAGFFFNGLAATVQSGSSLVPVAQVNNGSTVTLTWNCSVVDTSAFTIYYSNAAQGQQTVKPSHVGEWTSPALSSDTIFTVAVTTSFQGGQPLAASMSTGVSVQNPSLVASSLEVNGALDVTAKTSLSELQVFSDTILGNTQVIGTTVLSGTLEVSDDATLNKTLEVSGNTVLKGSLEVDSSLQVNGAAGVDGQISASSGAVISTGGNPGSGPGYPLLVTSGGLGSGVAIAWNYSGSTGETDFFNYGQGGDGGFNFYNNGHCGGDYPTSNPILLMSIHPWGIGIGNWTISMDENNNLCFNSNQGGNVLINGSQVIKSGDPCNITNDLGSLSGTNRVNHDPSANDAGKAYWGNPATDDEEAKLTINYGDPS